MTVVSSAKSYTERITPPSFAYMLDTPAVLTITIFLNFATFSIVSFTNCARSGQLQWEMASTRLSQFLVTSSISSTIFTSVLLHAPCLTKAAGIIPFLVDPITGLMFKYSATNAFSPLTRPALRSVSSVSTTKKVFMEERKISTSVTISSKSTTGSSELLNL